ncbi:hypothetical protein TrCOL_g1691 [Triparma columacea]|uniref:Pentatricopeptide repeat-containing protein n=1 Tax=Triparma columacea TaxID=722753 RepID=A0A9W7GK36_9STRA|nr:hypothetical protein TrCOL_g1691 [Triparma columacea]
MLPPGKSRLVTSLFSTFDYMRSDNIVETIDSLLKKAGADNVKLPGGVKKQAVLNSSSLMSFFNEVRHQELRNPTSEGDTYAILRAYSLLGDAEATRRMFFSRRALKHPVVTSNFDSHVEDDLTLYLRSMTAVTAKRGGGGGFGYKRKNWVSYYNKYKPAQVMADVFKVIKHEKVPLTTNHANLMLGVFNRALKHTGKGDSKREQKESEFLLDGVMSLLSDFETGMNEEIPSVRLDVYSYNTVVNCCCNANDPIKGLEFLHTRMRTPPNTVTFNILMWSFAKVGDAQSCEDILTMMTNHNVMPDSSTANAFVQANLLCNNMSGAISGVQSIWNQHQVLPSVHTARKILMHGLSKRERGGSEFECRRWVYLVKQILESKDWIDFGLEVNERQHDYWCNARSLRAARVSDMFRDAGFELEPNELWGELFGATDKYPEAGKVKVKRRWLRRSGDVVA